MGLLKDFDQKDLAKIGEESHAFAAELSRSSHGPQYRDLN